MYVLPYGQMSLWGATVITNLLSAIPWVGQDIVESTIIIFLIISVIYFKYISPSDIRTIIPLNKKEVLPSNIESILPTIGIVHNNALKKGNKNLRLNKEDYMFIPKSFLSYFVGLIDGDGYIQITKTSKGFISIKLTISLHLEDISTLQYIYSILKLGKINTYKDLKSPTCKLIINKTDLQEILFPLLIEWGIFFLTKTRIEQFNTCMHILKNNIKMFNEIPNNSTILDVFNLPKNAFDYTHLHFFKNWIVGFTCAEGSFFIKSNQDGCFQLKQRLHTDLFEAFKLSFDTNRKLNVTDNNIQFGVSSKDDIQKVINFFSFSGLHPLVGLKNIQYIKWVNFLRVSYRYGQLKYPDL